MIIQNEKCEVRTTCISRVCCYILAGAKQNKMWTKKVFKNPANESHGKWESRGHTFFSFKYQSVSDVKCHTNSWVYGHTAHAYSHDWVHKTKMIREQTSHLVGRVNYRFVNGGGGSKAEVKWKWRLGNRSNNSAKGFSLLLWQKTRETTDGWGRAWQGSLLDGFELIGSG